MEATSPTLDSGGPSRRAKLFWKLFASLTALSLAGILGLSAFFAGEQRALLREGLDNQLESAAAGAGELLAAHWPTDVEADVQDAVRSSAERSGVRLTVMGIDGRVLADSTQKDLAEVRAMENHRGRPEFISARRTGAGSSRRLSPTLQETFRYQAVRVDVEGKPVGVVRAALPTSAITQAEAELVHGAWRLAALASVAAVALSYLLAARMTEPLRTLAVAAEALAAGRHDLRLPAPGGGKDELSVLGQALASAARQLDQQQRQVRTTSQTQSTVLEGMTEGVIAVDRSERVLFANSAAGRLLGFTPQKAVGHALMEAVRSHELREVALASLRTRQLASSELAWRGPGKRTFEVLATPLPADPTPGVILVLRDVSDVKRLEQMRQQFIANVSHELKTPLSSIRAFTETLLSGAKNDAVTCERFLERIDEQSLRLQQLIVDMLSLARIESGQAVLDIVDVPVARVAKRCVSDFEPKASAGRVTLENLVDDATIQVRADEEALRQILSNLVDNAVKYTPPDGRASIRCRRDGAAAIIEVEDSGVGIPPEHHVRLFERFYRVDKARSRELGGTGLGLSIVKHLCQSMGGSVSVRSEPNRGSTFAVRLPLAGTHG